MATRKKPKKPVPNLKFAVVFGFFCLLNFKLKAKPVKATIVKVYFVLKAIIVLCTCSTIIVLCVSTVIKTQSGKNHRLSHDATIGLSLF